MTALFRLAGVSVCVATFAATLGACTLDRAPRGGDAEQQLAAATLAADVAKVSQLLTSGANPNLVVAVNGDNQSPWYLALSQLRPQRQETIAIIKVMLKAGADAHSVWGTNGGGSQPKESVWARFWRTGARQGGFGMDDPMRLVMLYPAPDAIKAMIDAGVDVNTQAAGITPLLAAIELRDVALMTYLEDHGAREKP